MNRAERFLVHFLTLVMFFGVFYFIASLVEIITHFTLVSGILNILTLTAEAVGLFYTTYFTKLIIEGSLGVGRLPYDADKIYGNPKVSVIIPTHNVNPAILDQTLQGFEVQTYKNFEVWVGDDSDDLELKNGCEEVCHKYGRIPVYFYYDPSNKLLKAGMINKLLSKIDGDFVAIFDVDQVPSPDILQRFVAFLQQHPKYSFVQAVYGYRNVTKTIQVFEAMSFLQFFTVNLARRKSDTCIFAGTTGCFRMTDLSRFPVDTVAEDFALSVIFITQGKRGYQLDEIGSWGFASEFLGEQISRLYRWTKGQASINSRYFKRVYLRKGVSLRDKFEIFMSSTIIIATTAFYGLGVMYILLYVGSLYDPNITIIRAFGWEFMGTSVWIIILPVLMVSVYALGVIYTIVYANRSKLIKLTLWRVGFFLLIGMITAPYLILPAIKGLLGLELPDPKKPKRALWMKKVNYLAWSVFFALLGAVFIYVGVLALLDVNMIALLFLSLGAMLIVTLPFGIIEKQKEKKQKGIRVVA